jgi:hypothetical protein
LLNLVLHILTKIVKLYTEKVIRRAKVMTNNELLDKLFEEVLKKCKECYSDPELLHTNFDEWKKQNHKHEVFTEVLDILMKEIRSL